jgi:hypothetical protein
MLVHRYGGLGGGGFKSSGGGKDPRKPGGDAPSGHAFDAIVEDVWLLILEFLERGGWLSLRGTSRDLRAMCDRYLMLNPAIFERVLQLGQRRGALLDQVGLGEMGLQTAYNEEIDELHAYIQQAVVAAARHDALGRYMAARSGSGSGAYRPPIDAISRYPGYDRVVDSSLAVFNGQRIVLGVNMTNQRILALVIAVLALGLFIYALTR